MPIDRPARAIAAACLALSALLVVAAAPASALEPPRPLPGYRAEFVTQTDEHPWNDCLWASAAMLLDKWTNGQVIRTHQQLRALSGDRTAGSTFEDLHVAFAKLGFQVPDNRAGMRLSWGELLSRLRRGAGAVVLGDYGQLPAWYGRWDHGFWKRGQPLTRKQKLAAKAAAAAAKAAGKPLKEVEKPDDNHAVYIERYDARRGRVWLMDPLGRGDWQGEWISVWALKRFAWFSGGAVFAVTTPIAVPGPFTGVRLVPQGMRLSADAVSATWGVRAPRGWRYQGADAHATIVPAADPLEAAARSALVAPRVSIDPGPPKPVASVSGRTLRVAAALPTAPGAYIAALSLTDRRFGRQVASSDAVAVFVPGERRALLRLNVLDSVLTAGGSLKVNASVSNLGEVPWTQAPDPDGEDDNRFLRTAREHDARLVAHWIRLDAPAADDGATGDARAAPGLLDLLRVPLAPGELARYRGAIRVPETLGRWALVLDVQDDLVGSYAALGSAPAVAVFEVVPARGIEAVD